MSLQLCYDRLASSIHKLARLGTRMEQVLLRYLCSIFKLLYTSILPANLDL